MTGAATLAAGWHRPSDVLAAFLVVGTWLGIVTFGLAVSRSRAEAAASAAERSAKSIIVLLTGVAVVALAVAAVGLSRTVGLNTIARERDDLLLAYGAGAAAIAGVAAVLLAAALFVAPQDARATIAPTAGVPA